MSDETAKEQMEDKEELLYEVKDAIAVVTLNRPTQRNALTFAMYEGLADICRKIGSDGTVKALVVTGAGGKAFAAGTDISQFRGFETSEDALDYEAKMDRVFTAIESCPVPTIAAITGACTGGGAAIAAACDIRIAAKGLRFGFPIARTLGNCLSIANLARLVALVGSPRTREMIFTARLIEAEEAKATGLVSEVLETPEEVLPRALELAGTLAGHAPLTLQATKEGLRRLLDAQRALDDSDLIALCYGSEDFREGMEAFLEKRKPHWKGR